MTMLRGSPRMYSQVNHDFFAPLDEPDLREPSPNPSESTSVSFASIVEEGASPIPSTRITSQSPDIPSAGISMDQLSGNQLNEAGSVTKPMLDASQEQMGGWIAALQRLVKGKVNVKEEVSLRVALDVPSSRLIPM